MALLEVEAIEAQYGPVRALRGISLTVGDGEIVAVLGANGAGKTTTLRAISGTVRRTGSVRLGGRELVRRAADSVARAGIAHVPEGRGTFVELSVRENLALGAYTQSRAAAREAYARVVRYFPWIGRRGDQQAATLSGGEQQMLAIARALMQGPRLLLLDEPSLGLAPIIVRELYETVRRLNGEDGLAVLVVEQNAALALDVASRAYVLEAGRVALEGPSGELRRNEAVRRSYLGY